MKNTIARGGSVLTFGPRRIGKTSLVLEVRRQLLGQRAKVLYQDLRTLMNFIKMNNVRSLEAELCMQIVAECGVTLSERYNNLHDCLRHLGSNMHGGQLVVILDEFDAVLSQAARQADTESEVEWLGFLGRLATTPPDLGFRFGVIISGHHNLGSSIDYAARYQWWLKDLTPIEVHSLSDSEAIEYFETKLGSEFIEEHHDAIRTALGSEESNWGSLSFSRSTIGSILRLSGNHPYYLSILMLHLVEHMNNIRQTLVCDNDVIVARDTAAARENHVASLWHGGFDTAEAFSDAQKQILMELVLRLRNPPIVTNYTFASVGRKRFPIGKDAFQAAMAEFIRLGVLERTEKTHNYRFRVDLMRFIIDKQVIVSN